MTTQPNTPTAPALTAQELALYLGQECKTYLKMKWGIQEGDGWIRGVMYGDGRNEVDVDTLHSGIINFDPSEVKPLLRPPSSLTEDEAQECWRLDKGEDWPAGGSLCVEILWGFKRESAAVWQYLLSIGIDVFGWLEDGRAIDKTKLETKP
jgi:hypothetical protein